MLNSNSSLKPNTDIGVLKIVSYEDRAWLNLDEYRTQHLKYSDIDIAIYFTREIHVNMEQLITCYIDNVLRTKK